MTPKETARSAGLDGQLAEVWGDVVSRPQLLRAIIIGAVVSLGVYWIALKTITPLAETPAIGRALAMLAGVLGCIAAGAICARLFKPKRIVVEEVPAGATWQREILEQIEQEGGDFGHVADLPETVVREMKEVGLYEVFKDHEARIAGRR